MSDEDGVSSPDEIAVLQAYIDLINSEREAIWARHNALLVANSLIIGALAISPAALWQNKWAALGMISAGAIISAAWLGITLEGWSAMKRHADLARKFASTYFKHLPNALDETLCDHAQTNIHYLILLVIGVFWAISASSRSERDDPCGNARLCSVSSALTLRPQRLVRE